MERDVWATDEVYGDYLIEGEPDKVQVSYFRRETRRKTRDLGSMTYDEIKQWIVADAKQQVKDQFTHLWDKLRIEIQTCLAEGFCKIPRDVATPEDIIKQFDACNQIKAISPEIALLQLGRVAEWYLLQALGHASRGDLYDLVRLGETAGLLNKNQAKLFGDIRTMYNALKHDTRFVLDSSILDGLVAKFEMFVKKQRESSL